MLLALFWLFSGLLAGLLVPWPWSIPGGLVLSVALTLAFAARGRRQARDARRLGQLGELP